MKRCWGVDMRDYTNPNALEELRRHVLKRVGDKIKASMQEKVTEAFDQRAAQGLESGDVLKVTYTIEVEIP